MSKLIFFVITFFSWQIVPAMAQQKENIVVLPIEVSPEFAAQKELIGTEIQKSLSNRYTVFYGQIVEDALQEEYSKDDCSAESCVQNVAIQFNGEVVVDASVQVVETAIYFRMKFLNVITGELEAVVQEACMSCNFSQLLAFVRAQLLAVKPTKSAGLTGLLEQQTQLNLTPAPVPAPVPQATRKAEVPVERVEKPTKLPKTEVKSPSYWKWGLGALVLAGAGGGGGGGGDSVGGSSYGDSGSDGDSGDFATRSTGTAFTGQGAVYVDNPNMLGGTHTYIELPAASNYKFFRNAYDYGGDGFKPNVQTTDTRQNQTYQNTQSAFRFQVNNGNIQKMTVMQFEGLAIYDFDTANGATITQSLTPSNVSHLSFFDDGNGSQFLGLALTDDYESNVNGIARVFFGVGERPGIDYDREMVAYHAGQPASDGTVPASETYIFEGYSAGHWVTPNDYQYWTTSEIEVEVDFSNIRAMLMSDNTLKSRNPTGANSWSSEPGLNFSVEGGQRFNPKNIGAYTTDASGDSLPTLGPDGPADGGSWNAFFYDATSAAEIAGTFTFYGKNGDNEASYIGAFGARR